MNATLKNILVALISAASLIVIVAALAFAYGKYKESSITRVANPDISLATINHLSGGNNLVFTTVAQNNSKIEWLNFGVLVRVLAVDGSLIRRCESLYFNYPFKSGPVDVEVSCPNMPAQMPELNYEVKLVGEY